MKKAEVAKDLDPDDLKILDWKEGKERNIRSQPFKAAKIRTFRRKLDSFQFKYLENDLFMYFPAYYFLLLRISFIV
jgi:hypothetical protein